MVVFQLEGLAGLRLQSVNAQTVGEMLWIMRMEKNVTEICARCRPVGIGEPLSSEVQQKQS